MALPSGSVDDEIDPTRHKVWRVEMSQHWTSFVVAETREEAEEVAEAYGTEDRNMSGDLDAYPVEMTGLTKWEAADGGSLPWGPIRWEGRELTLKEAIELVQNPPAELVPVYDTDTLLMPFADAPPPIWPES